MLAFAQFIVKVKICLLRVLLAVLSGQSLEQANEVCADGLDI